MSNKRYGLVSDRPLISRIPDGPKIARRVSDIPLTERVKDRDAKRRLSVMSELDVVYRAMWHSMVKRANGAPTMTREDLEDLIAAAGGRCQLSGIRFGLERVGKTSRRPYSPSIDRIDSTKGYEKSNCRIVCTCVNFARNEWGDEVLIAMCHAISNKHSNSDGIRNVLGKRERRAKRWRSTVSTLI